MKFTLIMCTIGRTEEPKRFLESLTRQTLKNFEVIIVDQNKDDRISSIAERFSDTIPVKILRTTPGLSKARNLALPEVESGSEIIAFPDDDCWYPPELLERVSDYYLSNASIDGISVSRSASEESAHDIEVDRPLSKLNLWGKVPSICLFLRSDNVRNTGSFDEQLGVGAETPWGAGEDTDYVLRSLEKGHTWRLVSSVRVFHAESIRRIDAGNKQRVRSYARGLGRVIRKHKLPLWMVLGGLLMSAFHAAKALIKLDRQEARWHSEALLGKAEGWMSLADRSK